jgi:DNA-binding NarL/FixJ family response regulator
VALPGGSSLLRVSALATVAWLALLQGDLPEAERRLDQAEVLAVEADLSAAQLLAVGVEFHRLRGGHALFSGRPADAVPEFELSIRLAHESGRPQEALFAQFQLTAALSHLGRPDAGLTALDAVTYADAVGENWMRALAEGALALAAFVEGDLVTAERRARQGIIDDRGFDDPVTECLTLELMCWIEAARQSADRAAILLGATDARWRSTGSAVTAFGPHLSAHHDRCVDTARRLLGGKAYARHFEQGARLGAREAVAFALKETPAGAGSLSAREIEVAARIHQGMINRDIADELVLSVRTVDSHVQRILGKLGFTSRAQIAAWYEATLVRVEPS